MSNYNDRKKDQLEDKLHDARAMIAERDTEIAELRAVVAAVLKYCDDQPTFPDWYMVRTYQVVDDLKNALGKYADEVAE